MTNDDINARLRELKQKACEMITEIQDLQLELAFNGYLSRPPAAEEPEKKDYPAS